MIKGILRSMVERERKPPLNVKKIVENMVNTVFLMPRYKNSVEALAWMMTDGAKTKIREKTFTPDWPTLSTVRSFLFGENCKKSEKTDVNQNDMDTEDKNKSNKSKNTSSRSKNKKAKAVHPPVNTKARNRFSMSEGLGLASVVSPLFALPTDQLMW